MSTLMNSFKSVSDTLRSPGDPRVPTDVPIVNQTAVSKEVIKSKLEKAKAAKDAFAKSAISSVSDVFKNVAVIANEAKTDTDKTSKRAAMADNIVVSGGVSAPESQYE